MGQFSLKKEDSEYVLSAEAAHEQVMALLQHYKIDIDALPDRKDQRAIEGACKKLVEYYRMGVFENVRAGSALQVRQHLQSPPGETKELLWARMGAQAKLATDGYDADERYARVYALVACLTGLPVEAIHQLEGVDLAAAEDLGVLFLLG